MSSGNTTINRGHGKRPSKEQVKAITAKVEDLMINGRLTSKEIGRELNMPPTTVDRYVKKVREKIAGDITDDARAQFIAETIEKYGMALAETEDLLKEAKTILEGEKKIQGVSLAIKTLMTVMSNNESFMDKFMDYAGTKDSVGDTYNFNTLILTPQWKEMEDLMCDFLDSKGLDPAEFIDYIEKRRMGLVSKREVQQTMGERKHETFDADYVDEVKEFLSEDSDIKVEDADTDES